jgi:hypothetical protein
MWPNFTKFLPNFHGRSGAAETFLPIYLSASLPSCHFQGLRQTAERQRQKGRTAERQNGSKISG